jgi:hypothetical protein
MHKHVLSLCTIARTEVRLLGRHSGTTMSSTQKTISILQTRTGSFMQPSEQLTDGPLLPAGNIFGSALCINVVVYRVGWMLEDENINPPAGPIGQPFRRRADQQQAVREGLSNLRHTAGKRAQEQDHDAKLRDKLQDTKDIVKALTTVDSTVLDAATHCCDSPAI